MKYIFCTKSNMRWYINTVKKWVDEIMKENFSFMTCWWRSRVTNVDKKLVLLQKENYLKKKNNIFSFYSDATNYKDKFPQRQLNAKIY